MLSPPSSLPRCPTQNLLEGHWRVVCRTPPPVEPTKPDITFPRVSHYHVPKTSPALAHTTTVARCRVRVYSRRTKSPAQWTLDPATKTENPGRPAQSPPAWPTPPAPPPGLGALDPTTKASDPSSQAPEQPRPSLPKPPCEEERELQRGRRNRRPSLSPPPCACPSHWPVASLPARPPCRAPRGSEEATPAGPRHPVEPHHQNERRAPHRHPSRPRSLSAACFGGDVAGEGRGRGAAARYGRSSHPRGRST
jgi:hypothetical protein